MKRLRMNEAAYQGARTGRRRVPSRPELQEQLTELVEQQVAISEVLRAIANSPHELQPIFDTILVNATRLCRAELGSLNLFEENGFRVVARSGPPDPYYSPREGLVLPVLPGNPLGRLVKRRSPVQVADLAADQSYLERMPGIVALVEVVGVRTELLVPMLKDEELIGAIAMFRARVPAGIVRSFGCADSHFIHSRCLLRSFPFVNHANDIFH
jgi:hypothetical protein